jgi:NCS1 family nucleobase:cation symporter-1
MLSAPSAFVAGGPKEGQFWGVFLPMITAVVGFWATLSLNISDFTRYATSQEAQFKGQTIGLPFFMAAFSFMSVAITSCSAVIFGSAVADPVALLAKADGGPLTTAVAMGGLLVATLSTNIAANIVAPANAFVNLAPSKLSFRAGGITTAVLGTAICPWRLMADASGYIFVWLIGYSALLGPIAGIMIADYFLVRRRVLDVDALYKSGEGTAYWYEGGFNTRAMWAFALGVAPNVPGFALSAGIVPAAAAESLRASFPGALRTFELVYGYAWFVGFFVGAGLYLALMRGESRAGENEEVLYTA